MTSQSRHVILRHVMLTHVILRHVMLTHVILRHVMLTHVILRRCPRHFESKFRVNIVT